MESYKEAIEEFIDKIEKLDEQCDLEHLGIRDLYLFSIIRVCRDTLMDAYNCIGNEDWILPDTIHRLTRKGNIH